ncbi:MAG: hypothetical protein VX777_01410 [Chlamydiota bacterium]|nr:hypothetical protein [Chlamydiota bacterium]
MAKKKQVDTGETEEERLMKFKRQMELLPTIHRRFRWVVVGVVLLTVIVTIVQILMFQ